MKKINFLLVAFAAMILSSCGTQSTFIVQNFLPAATDFAVITSNNYKVKRTVTIAVPTITAKTSKPKSVEELAVYPQLLKAAKLTGRELLTGISFEEVVSEKYNPSLEKSDQYIVATAIVIEFLNPGETFNTDNSVISNINLTEVVEYNIPIMCSDEGLNNPDYYPTVHFYDELVSLVDRNKDRRLNRAEFDSIKAALDMKNSTDREVFNLLLSSKTPELQDKLLLLIKDRIYR